MTTSLSSLSAALADRYRLERMLGQGGMATVYLAEDLKHRRKVAIKVLRPELAAVIGAERFLAEITTTANLQHPHILPLHDSGEVNGTVFYAMPFVEGESLRERLTRERQLPIADTVRIAGQIAGALDYAHRHGVIHRDIKPENILLHDGSALVADFGIALAVRRSESSARMTETGMSLGTPHYMSPEQALGERHIDARSDVYALGCVTYEMLMGEPPFSGPTAQAIIARVMTDDPPAIGTHRKSVPPHVEAAVLRALQKLPADRFAAAAEFARALEDPTFTWTGVGSGTGPGAARAVVPRSWLAAAVAAGIVLLLVAGISSFGGTDRGPTSRHRVILWQHSVPHVLDPGSEYVSTQAAIAPDGSTIVYTDLVDGTYRLMRKDRQEAAATPIPGTEGALSPFFSPDGRWVGYRTVRGSLRKTAVEGGGSITLADAITFSLAAAWFDDGTIVYTASDGLARIDADGGSSRLILPGQTAVASIAPLPGSRGFLYTRCPGNCAISSSVHLFTFATATSRLLVRDAAGAWYSPTGHLLYTHRSGGLYAAEFDLDHLEVTSGAVPVIDNVLPARLALSSSGAALYSTTTGKGTVSELMLVSRDGRAVPLDPAWLGDFNYPAVSPDGRALAVSTGEGTLHLWIRRSDGTRQKLTQGGVVHWRPSWTPDGRSVVFVSAGQEGDTTESVFDLHLAPVDGSAPPRLLQDFHFGIWEGEISPDGQWLVFRSDSGSVSQIRGRRTRGDTALVDLGVGRDGGTQVSFSPDGRWLAYTSTQTGLREVYVAPFPSMSPRRLVSRDGGTEPRWARSGRELFYKSNGQLMVVTVTPGSTLALGNPRALFPIAGYRSARNRPQYDITPDDQSFIMIRELTDAATGGMVYVENWFPELRARLKR